MSDTTLRDQILHDRDLRAARFMPVFVWRAVRDYEFKPGESVTWLSLWTCPEPVPRLRLLALGESSWLGINVTNLTLAALITSTETLGASYGWHSVSLGLPTGTEPGHVLQVAIAAYGDGALGGLVVDQYPLASVEP